MPDVQNWIAGLSQLAKSNLGKQNYGQGGVTGMATPMAGYVGRNVQPTGVSQPRPIQQPTPMRFPSRREMNPMPPVPSLTPQMPIQPERMPMGTPEMPPEGIEELLALLLLSQLLGGGGGLQNAY